jgi:hypothetical protein
MNLYAYVGNDPVNNIDPTGEMTKHLPGSRGCTIINGCLTGGMGPRSGLSGSSRGTGNTPSNIKAERMAANAEKGAKGEAITKEKLGDKVAGEQVSFKTSDGTRTRADFVTKDKGVTETKTGDAKLSSGQEKLKSDIEAGREVTPVGANAQKAGLTPNEPTKMSCFKVDRPC